MDNPEVYDGKDFKTLLKDICDHTEDKRTQIKSMMDTLASLITNIHDAGQVAPLLKDFIDVGIKNDEHLVKVATIVQRVMSSNTNAGVGSDGFQLSDAERDDLLKAAAEELADDKKLLIEETSEIKQLVSKADEILEEVDVTA